MERGRSDGFVLPLTLAALALMALSLWAAVSSFEMATRNVRDLRDALEFDISATNIEGRLMYVAATEPLGPAGFRMAGLRISRAQMLGMEPLTEAQLSRGLPRYLRLDGRWYEPPASPDGREDVSNGIQVTLQDRAGLVNFNLPDETVITRALQLVDVDTSSAAIMAAVLADYVDRDDLRRIDGAERDFYARLEREGPLNLNLRVAEQAFNAHGWQALSSQQRSRLLQFTNAGPPSHQKNVNTASVSALQAWLGIDASTASRMVAVRETAPFMSGEEFAVRMGIVLPEGEFSAYTAPASAIRVRIVQREPRCRLREFWLYMPEQASSRPLFFGGGEGMTCGSLDLESTVSDGFAAPFPDGELPLPQGER